MTQYAHGDGYQVVWNGSEWIVVFDDILSAADIVHIGVDPQGGGETIFTGVFLSSTNINSLVSGKIGAGGNIIAKTENYEMNQSANEGKIGSLLSEISNIVSLIYGSLGVEGVVNTGLFISEISDILSTIQGKTGKIGSLNFEQDINSLFVGKEGKEGYFTLPLEEFTSLVQSLIGSKGNLSSELFPFISSVIAKEGKEGSLNFEQIISSLFAGKEGKEGSLNFEQGVNSLFVGKEGNTGLFSSSIGISRMLFAEGLPPIIYEGTIAGSIESIELEFFGKTGIYGNIIGEIFNTLNLFGKIGISGSYTISLDNITSMIQSVIGSKGTVSSSISAGSELIGKLGIYGTVSSEIENLDLKLLEVVFSSKRVYHILISTKTGQVVFFLPPKQI